VIQGVASWYGPGFQGRRTASGERFSRHAYTLAHRGLPFGTRLQIVNLLTGRCAVGRVNDRGPFVRGRKFDLSQALARRLGIGGVGRVRCVVLPGAGRNSSPGEVKRKPDVFAERPRNWLEGQKRARQTVAARGPAPATGNGPLPGPVEEDVSHAVILTAATPASVPFGPPVPEELNLEATLPQAPEAAPEAAPVEEGPLGAEALGDHR
jgi:rare lipoprotein A